jgi:CPA1 family monovalent cation:H+ antiporter
MNALSAIIIVIPLCLFARLLTVAIPMVYFKKRKSYPPYINTILTWGGLRGALALAMALSLPLGTERNIILVITYVWYFRYRNTGINCQVINQTQHTRQ